MKPSRKKVPSVPTGHEYRDLLWSQLMRAAVGYVPVVPQSADHAWATEHGLRLVAIGLLKQWAASDELQWTPNRSTLRRLEVPFPDVLLGGN